MTLRALTESARFEIIPLKSVDEAIASLPIGAKVSVTCSPAKGIDTTLTIAARVRRMGHHVVPHISARVIEEPAHVRRIARWTVENDVDELFVVAGDAERPVGPYDGAAAFLREFVSAKSAVRHIGVTAYPDGHPLISEALQREALHAKQEILAAAGVSMHATTQMCFDTEKVNAWIAAQRADGITLPFHIGIPGAVDATKLATLGVRLGIGQSMRFLRKNKGIVRGLMTLSTYDPTPLVEAVVPHAETLGVTGLHLFTFNEVRATEDWRQTILGGDVTT